MLSYLSSLLISVLRSFDTDSNKFHDRTNRLYDAASLTRCYTQHALRPVIDSKINHIRHFIKIPFINKGLDFIDLPSIFRDKSVQSSIPNYFKNCEVPFICYKYNIYIIVYAFVSHDKLIRKFCFPKFFEICILSHHRIQVLTNLFAKVTLIRYYI